MKEKEALQGLNCPGCGGIVTVPEGMVIVICPYCEMRSYLRGEQGILRYEAPQRIEQQQLDQILRKFLRGNLAIAPTAARQAKISEVFLVHLPFWTVWARVAGWIFGEKLVGSGDDKRYEPREMQVVQEMTWNGAACDVSEFGVTSIPMMGIELQPFDAQSLHRSGMVFEPVSSANEARQKAENQFVDRLESNADLDRISQLFMCLMRQRFGLVYHPLWVMRFMYRQRTYQVVVDAYSGKVLYGKAPGNVIYRAAVLVLGMATGAFLAIDGSAFGLWASNDDDAGFGIALALFAVGAVIMFSSYRAFRRGEQYEYCYGGKGLLSGIADSIGMITDTRDIEKWIKQFS